MLALAQIRLLQQSPSQFLAYDPPYQVFGAVFLSFSALAMALMIVVRLKADPWRGAYWIGVALPVIVFLIGVTAFTAKAYISASRTTGQIEVRREILWMSFEGDRVPLQDVQFARVENMKNLRRVVLVLHSGRTVSLTSATDRDGYDLLAEAINHLLAH